MKRIAVCFSLLFLLVACESSGPVAPVEGGGEEGVVEPDQCLESSLLGTCWDNAIPACWAPEGQCNANLPRFSVNQWPSGHRVESVDESTADSTVITSTYYGVDGEVCFTSKNIWTGGADGTDWLITTEISHDGGTFEIREELSDTAYVVLTCEGGTELPLSKDEYSLFQDCEMGWECQPYDPDLGFIPGWTPPVNDESGDEAGDEAGDETGDESGDEAGDETGDEKGTEVGFESGEEGMVGGEEGNMPGEAGEEGAGSDEGSSGGGCSVSSGSQPGALSLFLLLGLLFLVTARRRFSRQ